MRGIWIGSVAVTALAVNVLVNSAPFERFTEQPIKEAGRYFDQAALLLQRSSQARRDRMGSIERTADFPPSHPLRKLADGIGMLQMTFAATDGREGTYTCTAALVTPTLVLANHHCAEHKDQKPVRAVIWLRHVDGGSADIVPLRPILVEGDKDLDYALLEVLPAPGASLPKPIGLRKARDAVPGERLFLIHHSQGAPQQISRAFCAARMEQLGKGLLRHTCPSDIGSSGALVFAESDGAVVALHHSVGTTADTTRGFATRITAILARSTRLNRIN